MRICITDYVQFVFQNDGMSVKCYMLLKLFHHFLKAMVNKVVYMSSEYSVIESMTCISACL